MEAAKDAYSRAALERWRSILDDPRNWEMSHVDQSPRKFSLGGSRSSVAHSRGLHAPARHPGIPLAQEPGAWVGVRTPAKRTEAPPVPWQAHDPSRSARRKTHVRMLAGALRGTPVQPGLQRSGRPGLGSPGGHLYSMSHGRPGFPLSQSRSRHRLRLLPGWSRPL